MISQRAPVSGVLYLHRVGADGRVVGPVVGHDDQDEEAGERKVRSGELIEMPRSQVVLPVLTPQTGRDQDLT